MSRRSESPERGRKRGRMYRTRRDSNSSSSSSDSRSRSPITRPPLRDRHVNMQRGEKTTAFDAFIQATMARYSLDNDGREHPEKYDAHAIDGYWQDKWKDLPYEEKKHWRVLVTGSARRVSTTPTKDTRLTISDGPSTSYRTAEEDYAILVDNIAEEEHDRPCPFCRQILKTRSLLELHKLAVHPFDAYYSDEEGALHETVPKIMKQVELDCKESDFPPVDQVPVMANGFSQADCPSGSWKPIPKVSSSLSPENGADTSDTQLETNTNDGSNPFAKMKQSLQHIGVTGLTNGGSRGDMASDYLQQSAQKDKDDSDNDDMDIDSQDPEEAACFSGSSASDNCDTTRKPSSISPILPNIPFNQVDRLINEIESKFPCPICHKGFKSLADTKDHYIACYGVSFREGVPITCPECPAKFAQLDHFRPHFKLCHWISQALDQAVLVQHYKAFDCQHNCVKFKNKSVEEVVMHERDAHESDMGSRYVYRCGRCSFTPKESFSTNALDHAIELHKDDETGLVFCPFCLNGNGFHINQIKEHIRVKHPKIPTSFACFTCSLDHASKKEARICHYKHFAAVYDCLKCGQKRIPGKLLFHHRKTC